MKEEKKTDEYIEEIKWRNVGDIVTINAKYQTSTGDQRIPIKEKTVTISRAVKELRNPYYIKDIGWIDDSCIVEA